MGAPVSDRAEALQLRRGLRDAGATDAEHEREELVREPEFLAPDAVPRGEQPARAARQQAVRAVACDELLRDEQTRAQHALREMREDAVSGEDAAEVGNRDADDRPGDLAEADPLRGGPAEQRLDGDEALSPDDRDLVRFAGLQADDDGDHRSDRKINVVEGRSGRDRGLAMPIALKRRARQQRVAFGCRERVQDAVSAGVLR
ncbi:MAG TPA: hypothetical protein VFB22_03190 [Candidatus Baltobacteraceae bacterium]|nr:hypothetical protein [Candidatus Baltobacteraceae bacterium]